jgi:hypothetical protein
MQPKGGDYNISILGTFLSLIFFFGGWTNQGYPSQKKKKKLNFGASPQPINMSQ